MKHLKNCVRITFRIWLRLLHLNSSPHIVPKRHTVTVTNSPISRHGTSMRSLNRFGYWLHTAILLSAAEASDPSSHSSPRRGGPRHVRHSRAPAAMLARSATEYASSRSAALRRSSAGDSAARTTVLMRQGTKGSMSRRRANIGTSVTPMRSCPSAVAMSSWT